MAQREALIVGGGLAGIATAWALREQGLSVTVLDAREGPALETSFANAGALTPSEPEPWNAPGVQWELMRSLFDPHAAMKLRLGPLPGLVGWGLRFLRNATRARYHAASRANFALSRFSLEQTRRVRDTLSIDFDNLQAGTLKICRDQAGLDAAIAAAKRLEDLGLNYRVLSPDETIALEPQLATLKTQIAGAIHYPDDESGDAHQFTTALAKACEAAGVNFEWNTPVLQLVDRAGRIIGVETEREVIEVDAVVLASGQASWKLLRPLGLHLPVRPVKGYSLTLDMAGQNDRPGLPVVDEALHAIITPMGDRLRIAGTAEIAGEDTSVRKDRIENLRALLRQLYPDLAVRLERADELAWAGLRPMSADGRPFIGQTRADGLWLNTGHGHLGWTQALGSGMLLTQLMSGQTPAIDPAPYSARRF